MHAVLAALVLSAGSAPLVTLSATYLPPVKGAEATIAVQFSPTDPNIRVNEDPAPRLKLDQEQQILAEKAASARRPRPAVGEAHYLDPSVPVAFPVLLKAGTGPGEHTVKATVTYFYCSKSEGWCRKGLADISVPVRVP